jgi:hypothetical protein
MSTRDKSAVDMIFALASKLRAERLATRYGRPQPSRQGTEARKRREAMQAANAARLRELTK